MKSMFLPVTVTLLVLAAACGDDASDGPLPDDFPVHENSRLTESGQDADDFVGVWETQDRGADVVRSITDQLADGPWRIVGQPAGDEQVVIRVENPEAAAGEPDEGTIVIIDDGETTRIVEEVGRKGTTRTPRPEATEPPDDPPATPSAGGLPPGFPADRVPLPSDATITEATSPGGAGAQIFFIGLQTALDPAAIVEFYEEALSAQGWNKALVRNDSGNFILTYGDGADSVTVSGSGDESGSAATITLVLGD